MARKINKFLKIFGGVITSADVGVGKTQEGLLMFPLKRLRNEFHFLIVTDNPRPANRSPVDGVRS
jgi:hypothetical protein